MKIAKVPDQYTGNVLRWEIGEHQVCVYPVLFGYRVRIGRQSQPMEYITDWCAGNNTMMVNLLLQCAVHAIHHTHLLEDIPLRSNRKPVHNDPEFMKWVHAHYPNDNLYEDVIVSSNELLIERQRGIIDVLDKMNDGQ